MTSGTTFVHLSDLHIGDPANPALLSDTTATLGVVVEMLVAMSPAPSFVAISGDLTQSGDPASYRVVREATATLACPVIHAFGNHDDPRGFAEGLEGRDGRGDAREVRDVLIDGIHLLVLDTSVPGRIGGALDAQQFRWLGEALGRYPECPKVVMMHHPPALDGEMGWKVLDPADTARLAEVLRGRNVTAILTGHIHQDRVALWEGIPVVTVSGQHATIDALHTDGLRSVRGASFGLCRLTPGFSVTFVQLPSDRAELERLSRDTVLGFV